MEMKTKKTWIAKKTQKIFDQVNEFFTIYGSMTVRQVFYQLVSKGYDYRQIQNALKVGRERGLIPLDKIVDRSRPSYGINVYDNPQQSMDSTVNQYKLDYWNDQPYRVEVWTEKDALSQIMYEVAGDYRVPVRVTRGFLSDSNKIKWQQQGLVVLYFGDFDPSGLCMDEELDENNYLSGVNFERISLTIDQTKQYNLPSVPVKMDDPRAKKYVTKYGKRCWELDALDPNLLRALVSKSIRSHITFDLEQKIREENIQRQQLVILRDAMNEVLGGESVE